MIYSKQTSLSRAIYLFKQTMYYYYLFTNLHFLFFFSLLSYPIIYLTNYSFIKIFIQKKKKSFISSFFSLSLVWYLIFQQIFQIPPFFLRLSLPFQTIFILPASYPISKISKRGKKTSFLFRPLPSTSLSPLSVNIHGEKENPQNQNFWPLAR